MATEVARHRSTKSTNTIGALIRDAGIPRGRQQQAVTLYDAGGSRFEDYIVMPDIRQREQEREGLVITVGELEHSDEKSSNRLIDRHAWMSTSGRTPQGVTIHVPHTAVPQSIPHETHALE